MHYKLNSQYSERENKKQNWKQHHLHIPHFLEETPKAKDIQFQEYFQHKKAEEDPLSCIIPRIIIVSNSNHHCIHQCQYIKENPKESEIVKVQK